MIAVIIRPTSNFERRPIVIFANVNLLLMSLLNRDQTKCMAQNTSAIKNRRIVKGNPNTSLTTCDCEGNIVAIKIEAAKTDKVTEAKK